MHTPLSRVKGALGSLVPKRVSGDGDCPSAPAPRTSHTDRYGFEVSLTEQQVATVVRCRQREAAQLEKWEQYQRSGGLPPEDKLKKLCRKGVPPELRDWVWMEVSGANQRRQRHHSSYFAAMARMAKHESPFVHQIELDLPRTYPANAWIQSEEGQAALRRVLSAFAQHKRDVGYCQGMNYIAALLLLAMGRNEEKAFWLMASLIDDESEGILYQDMFTSNLTGTHVEMRSLWELVTVKLPRLAQHLRTLKCDISLLATDWFICLFATSMPSETVARVWDALLNEGPKVLFRVALALLKLGEPALLERSEAGEVLQALRTVTLEMFDSDRLLKVAFDGIGSLPMDTIRRYRVASQQAVDHEIAVRETNRNLQRAMQQGFVMPAEEVHVLREAEQLPPEPREEQQQAGRGAWALPLQAIGEKLERGKEKLLRLHSTPDANGGAS